jgi:hypothetical protein
MIPSVLGTVELDELDEVEIIVVFMVPPAPCADACAGTGIRY